MIPKIQRLLFIVLFLHASLSFSASNTNKSLTKFNQSARALLPASSKLSNSNGFAAEIQGFDEDYLVSLAIGTPPIPIMLIPSTMSSLIWAQSQPCNHCFNQTKSLPIYDPKRSSSFSKLPCRNTLCQALPSFQCTPDCKYKYEYVSANTQGFMGIETLTIGGTKIDGITFGRGNSNTFFVPHGSGVLGLNREPLSLVTQLGVKRFSYCLPSSKGSKGRILFGSQAILKDSSKDRALSTKLVHNPSDPYGYYVSLKGITVGETRLPIPDNTFEIKKDGTSGASSIAVGSFFPTLEKTAFRLLKEEFRSQLKLNIVVSSDGFDACYSLPLGQSVNVPKLVYNFDGADLELPVGNYMHNYVDKQILCLYILESKYGKSSFGSLHQQDMQMLFNLEEEVLSIVPNSQCEDI
ncbi:Aspartic peptidase A1 family protein [Dioscorea alata]|uniref:Aspartic peptidase A1 family protein n=1 Tax=Dioscorea alata TaxID=55571 RepID=A0ACB7WKC7_DIOAL|nr:Aspartic peptidase A1 family protein [Dioscorea alata]